MMRLNELVDIVGRNKNFPKVSCERKNGENTVTTVQVVLSKARPQFVDTQYVVGPQVDEPTITTNPIKLVSRWLLD